MPPFKCIVAALAFVAGAVLLPSQLAAAGNVGVAAAPGGCLIVSSEGGVFAYGVPFQGSASPYTDSGVVGVALAPGGGYYLASADGGVFAFGGAPFHGSAAPYTDSGVVGMAVTPKGGYYLASADGGVFAFGGAPFHGSATPYTDSGIVGIALAPGGGYYLASDDGGVFAFGGAPFHGSAAPYTDSGVVGMAIAPKGGYYLASADGGVFAFGGAPFHGSAAPYIDSGITGIAVSPTSGAYHLASAGSRGYAFGPNPKVCVMPKLGAASAEGFVWPLNGPITGWFGQDNGRNHKGLDINGETGDPVKAAKGGTVTFAGGDGGYGNKIVIDHGGGVTTVYAHLSAFNVGVGATVKRGQVIGAVGSTGHSTGSHLHFEVRVHGQPRNPLDFLP